MPPHLPRSPRLLAWLAAAAWLAVALPAAGQRNDDVQPLRPPADIAQRFPVFEWALLIHRAAMEREIAARYPQTQRDAQVTGVLLRFRILSDGRVDSTSISVVQTWNAAPAALGMDIAKRLRFAPARALGTPVPIWIDFPVNYTLPNGSGVAQGSIDQEPRLRNRDEVARQIASRYPSALRNRGIAGSVLLRLKVTSEGTVDAASISMQQATDTAIVGPAILVARSMRFTPALADGQSALTWITIPVHFTLPMPQESPGDEGTYELSAVEVQPRLLNGDEIARQLEARYPPALRDSGVTGVVVMRLRIMENGTADPASIAVESATHAAFGEAARGLVGGMRFAPAKVGGRPVKVWVTVPITFQLEGPPPARRGYDSTLPRAAPPPTGARP